MSYPPSTYDVPPLFDEYSKAATTIQHSHQEIHDGEAYSVSLVVTITASTTINCSIQAPNTSKRVHFYLNCETAGNGVTVAMYEAPTISVAGTAITPRNRNRNASDASVAIFLHDNTVTSNGTLLYTVYMNTNKNLSSNTHATDEFILKQGTTYLMTITADSGTSATFSGRAEWYEIDKGQGL